MKSIAYPSDVKEDNNIIQYQIYITEDGTGVPDANESGSTSRSVRALEFSPSPSPGFDQELSLLSPATGQHNAVHHQ